MVAELTDGVDVVTGTVEPEGLGPGSLVWGSLMTIKVVVEATVDVVRCILSTIDTFRACIVILVPGMSMAGLVFLIVSASTMWLVLY